MIFDVGVQCSLWYDLANRSWCVRIFCGLILSEIGNDAKEDDAEGPNNDANDEYSGDNIEDDDDDSNDDDCDDNVDDVDNDADTHAVWIRKFSPAIRFLTCFKCLTLIILFITGF